MTDLFLDWIARFSIMCALNYSKMALATAFVAGVMAAVLLILRWQVLKDESWLNYLGFAFTAFAVQYGFRAYAAWQRRGDYSQAEPRQIERWTQAIISNLNSLFFVAAALALLYWLPQRWWRTRWASLLIAIFAVSALAGLNLHEPWNRAFDALLSAAVLGLLSWAMYMNSGTRQRRRWALLNLFGGFSYAILHLIYAFVPKIAHWRPLAAVVNEQLHPSSTMPSVTEVLDSGIFALAFVLKFLLFIGALLVAMRCLSAFSPLVTRSILEPVKTQRGVFLASGGIVRAMAESIGADAAALCFRLAGNRRDEVVTFTWVSNGTVSENVEERAKRPSPDSSTIGRTLVSDDIISSRNWKKDPRFKEGGYRDVVAGVLAFLNTPLLYHGAVVGCLNFEWRNPWASFTATDVQRVRQIADYITPVIQTERWLRAIGDLRERLQHYNFDATERARGVFVGRVAQEIHDVLAPLGTLLLFEFGFRAQWAMCVGSASTIASDDPSEGRHCGDIEQHFMTLCQNNTVFVEIPIPLMGNHIGKIVLATRGDHDELTHPSLTLDTEQLKAIAVLVKDALLDLHRIHFGGILHDLQSRLGAGGYASEMHWLRTLRDACIDAGLRGLAVYTSKSEKFHEEASATMSNTLSRRIGANSVVEGERRIYHLTTDGAQLATALVELRLLLCAEVLYVEVERTYFRAELAAELPWKMFLDRLADAADAALMRIRDIEFVEDAMQSEVYELLVHELRNQALEFHGAVGWIEENLFERSELATDERRRSFLENLKESASKFTDLARAVERPLSPDTRSSVPLSEVRDRVDRVYAGRLASPGVALTWETDDRWVIGMPLHLAFIVLLNFVQNAREAIGSAGGHIFVRGEQAGNGLLIHVDDTGCGISEEHRREIGRLGFTTRNRGSGRGLYLSRRALHRHQGDWQLADRGPNGVKTRFTIRFPRSSDDR